MKTGVRVLLGLTSVVLAYLAEIYAERQTDARLARGGLEGTPATVVVFSAVFLLILIATLVAGNLLINCYLRKHSAK